jgi:hypothetical protein
MSQRAGQAPSRRTRSKLGALQYVLDTTVHLIEAPLPAWRWLVGLMTFLIVLTLLVGASLAAAARGSDFIEQRLSSVHIPEPHR